MIASFVEQVKRSEELRPRDYDGLEAKVIELARKRR